MGLIAEYQITYQQLPLTDVATAVPGMTIELTVGQPNQAGPPPFVVRATGGAFEELERAFEASAFVRSYSLIARGQTTRAYQLLPAASMEEQLGTTVSQPAQLRALSDNESIVERIAVTPEGWVQQRWFADRTAFREYCAFWRENAAAFSVHRLTESTLEEDRNEPPRMTDRQREALHTAYEMGYFEIPRTATLTEVATALGISASSLSERLRRAQTRLIEHSPVEDKSPH
ncbi:helix-turn-helix domain-containing protein [Halocatena salina]|uniref:Helix-turn-helix domain-containing protein n=1 Tax=Halocatena salina TaxID=2934340 RepID=A0A8T9ZZV0_9EURY|nr:helix-turn-helix domain-containing protein [Halocatena salina]UPM42371.1 helix-turn-helix domain-containing protein [Halocatena salina]